MDSARLPQNQGWAKSTAPPVKPQSMAFSVASMVSMLIMLMPKAVRPACAKPKPFQAMSAAVSTASDVAMPAAIDTAMMVPTPSSGCWLLR